MFQSILVPLDGSDQAEHALEAALVLAGRTGASVHVMTTTWGADTEGPQQYLERLVAGEEGVAISRHVVGQRFPAEAILGVAAELDDPLVCMSTHGRGGLAKTMLGSVAEDVLRAAPGLVVLCGPAFDPAWPDPFGHAVACYDGSPTAEVIVSPAVEWSRSFGMPLSFVEVLEPGALRRPAGGVGLSETAGLRALARRLDREGVVANWEAVYGENPADSIVDFAARLPASLLVMSTHGRTGAAPVALGGVTLRVVRTSTCPVLVARSHQFEA
jgi:nucleotide-binding universal stress UspA family protein